MWEALYPPLDWEVYKRSWPHAQHSQFIQTRGQKWHVQIMGQGPTLLLLHGTGASAHTWRELLPILAKQFTVVCPDLPGHAFSASRGTNALSLDSITCNLEVLLAGLNQWPVAIVGHSAGAAIAAQLVLRTSSKQVPFLIGLNPAWLPLPGLANWLFPPAAKLMALNPWSAKWFSKQARKKSVVERLIKGTGSILDASGIALYEHLLQAPSHVNGVLGMMASWNLEDLAKNLSQIASPVMIELGLNDLAVPAELALRANSYLPHAKIFTHQGLGHLAHEENPLGTCQNIVQWLAEIDT
jgi:magnesium chelatase accessory protein